ncbi:MAG: hypothetical protein P8X55_15160 [Desulfosarcinaceae bacterium]
MTDRFRPDAHMVLIGSQPLTDHAEAMRLIFEHTPEIPTWAQLPVYANEAMVPQFADGLPGLVSQGDRLFVDLDAADIEDQLLAFFEAYLDVTEQDGAWDASPFVLSPDSARGFFTLLEALPAHMEGVRALKGHVTGPITFCTALKDQRRRAIFYQDALRDAAVKLLALKAGWQARQLARFGRPVIIFIDEPALAGYGSSEFISISREAISACLEEVIKSIHDQGALAGVHVCANTDWSMLLDSSLDVVNFDAHGYFDKFMLYSRELRNFLQSGRILAWGLVPTLDVEAVEAATMESLWQGWCEKRQAVCNLGITDEVLRSQSLITPSCGTGSLTPALNRKVLQLTQALSEKIRQE